MKKRISTRSPLVLLTMSLAAAPASANPTGPQVANGQVTFNQAGNFLQITNSPNSIINWQSFSIGVNEITRFVQQSASSAVLNRVATGNPSAILGALQSNGRVFLINPGGILFGAGSQVDVAGLVASTLNLSDADFLGGRLRFAETPGAGAVVNQGAITGAGGGIYLVGAGVTNGGVISNPQGEIVLAAGKSVELVNPATPSLRVEINAPDNEALNLGRIIASSGRVGIYAGLIGNSGTLNADRAVAGPAGEILLKATTNIAIEAGSLSASGGTVKLEANAVTVNAPVTAGSILVNAVGSVSIGPGTSLTTDERIALQAGSNLNLGAGAVLSSGQVAISAQNIGNPSVAAGCVNSISQPCSGLSAPSTGMVISPGAGNPGAIPMIVVSSGPGNLMVNGTNVPLGTNSPAGSTDVIVLQSAGQSTPVLIDFAALAGAARVFQQGNGQLQDALQSTSRINDVTRTLDASTRILPSRGRSPASE